MVLLVISCGLGIWVSINGDRRVAEGLEPDRYGAAGVPKFPHGVVIHAIQWLPAIAWVARVSGLSVATRRRLVWAATVASVALLVFALTQTLAGRARFELPAAVQAPVAR
jgi:hypothetical protein